MHVTAPNREMTDYQVLETFVQMAFRGILGREAEPEGLNHFVTRIWNKERTT